MNRLRSELYFSLAEMLAPGVPPGWLVLPGREWPLYEAVCGLAASSAAARRAAHIIGMIPGEPLTRRKARYTKLFCVPGRPRFWLYESAYRSGRLLGPETLAVEKWYRSAGVEVSDAELPDHASVELAFLATLASRSLERNFITHHAGCWLPELGRDLASTGDEIYGPIGDLLADWLEEAVREGENIFDMANPVDSLTRMLPVIQTVEKCSLCGFCAQVCPTCALSIRENECERELILSPVACILCGKCVRACQFEAVQILPQSMFVEISAQSARPAGDLLILRRSTLATCRACGSIIASQAELEYLNQQLGYPAWLETCPECRAIYDR